MNRVVRKILVLAVASWAMIGGFASPAAQACPMCKAALEEDDSKPRAYQASILFMLSMPTAIFGSLAVVLTVLNRRESQALRDTEFLAEQTAVAPRMMR